MSANEVIIASSADDAQAVDSVRDQHTELVGRVAALTDALLSAAERGADFEPTRAALVDFLTGQLLPYAAAQEERFYPAAARTDRARPLIESLIVSHRVLDALARKIHTESSPVRAAAAAYALQAVLEVQVADENERLLPIVAADPEVSVAEVTQGLPDVRADQGCGHGCSCGEADSDIPVLDVRDIPHAIRHATVFGAFDAVPPGGALQLVAHHDPIPLLHQLDQRADGRLAVSYLERGPEVWRLLLSRG